MEMTADSVEYHADAVRRPEVAHRRPDGDVSAHDRAPTPPAHGVGPVDATSFANVLRSEWTKLWSVRSTLWTLLARWSSLTVGFAALFAWGDRVDLEPRSTGRAKAIFDATADDLAGLHLRPARDRRARRAWSSPPSTPPAASAPASPPCPQRLRLLAAKGVVLARRRPRRRPVTSFVAFFVGQAFFGHGRDRAHLGDPQRAARGHRRRPLPPRRAGCSASPLGALLRHTAGADHARRRRCCSSCRRSSQPAAGRLGQDDHDVLHQQRRSADHLRDAGADSLSPWTGYLVFTLWWVVILAVASWLLNRRDA